MRTKLFILSLAALIVWGMKRHYAEARADDLWWMLRPTAQLVGTVTGTDFRLVPGEGYFADTRLFLIEKSCAGINFMIAAFCLLVFTLWRRLDSVAYGACAVATALSVSYAAAVLANAARITIAMWLAAHPSALTTVTPAQMHRVEGIVVYFAGLVLLHEGVQRLDALLPMEHRS